MRFLTLLFAITLYLCAVSASPALIKDGLKELDSFGKFLGQAKNVPSELKSGINGANLKCLLCGIVGNELEGMLAENETEANIQAKIEKTICSHLPSTFKADCETIVSLIPIAIDELEKKKSISVFCVEHHYCAIPFHYMPDWTDVPKYEINLDLAPENRWTEICSNSTFKGVMQTLIGGLEGFFDNSVIVSELGKLLNTKYFPKEFAAEIRGCASALGVDYGWLTFVNIGYEITDACTSIVAQTEEGKIIHGRNMDFWDGIWLNNLLKNITLEATFTKNNQTQFVSTMFAGYVGVLSGMRPNGFSVSIDTRYYPEGISQFFKEIIVAITDRNASIVSHLTRKTLENEHDYAAALENLSNDELIADVYYILAGVSAGEGAVISRNRNNASDVWNIDTTAGRWWLTQTNYDHWNRPPWFDNRVDPANNAMKAEGRPGFSVDTMKRVLSVKPVLNIQSTFGMVAVPADSFYFTSQRNCEYPCVE